MPDVSAVWCTVGRALPERHRHRQRYPGHAAGRDRRGPVPRRAPTGPLRDRRRRRYRPRRTGAGALGAVHPLGPRASSTSSSAPGRPARPGHPPRREGLQLAGDHRRHPSLGVARPVPPRQRTSAPSYAPPRSEVGRGDRRAGNIPTTGGQDAPAGRAPGAATAAAGGRGRRVISRPWRGRSVTSGSGSTGCPGTSSRAAALRHRPAITRRASSSAKLLPMQTRGSPPPKGK